VDFVPIFKSIKICIIPILYEQIIDFLSFDYSFSKSMSRQLQKHDLALSEDVVHFYIAIVYFFHHMPIFYLFTDMEQSWF
jgi:hypothetical protein